MCTFSSLIFFGKESGSFVVIVGFATQTLSRWRQKGGAVMFLAMKGGTGREKVIKNEEGLKNDGRKDEEKKRVLPDVLLKASF